MFKMFVPGGLGKAQVKTNFSGTFGLLRLRVSAAKRVNIGFGVDLCIPTNGLNQRELRDRSQINYRSLLLSRRDLIVPVTLKCITFDFDFRHFGVADLAAFEVIIFI